ncbi:hypothetical protein CEXT_254691 [Caerostris extrusa]|uniref:Uncharacterized protein n=1 Tax=Caerostris extrusa TaxID=172846 RepID=A0AAV4Q1Y7_CAEEX|nr:hypothetical protein CEXT_254691 [Caerostris extrusa]
MAPKTTALANRSSWPLSSGSTRLSDCSKVHGNCNNVIISHGSSDSLLPVTGVRTCFMLKERTVEPRKSKIEARRKCAGKQAVQGKSAEHRGHVELIGVHKEERSC